MTTKSATLAKQNERAKDIAERQKSATSATLAERTNTMQEKQMKAEGIRAALMKEQVDKAAQEVSKARELSNKAKEELQDDSEQKRLSLENNLKNASARKQALVAAIAEKAGGEYTKAVLMSAQKKKKEEATAMGVEEKLGEKLEGASRRRELFMETQTDKLASTALWGAALRHNACESDAAPVAFEVSVDDVRVKSPASKSVGKSPVQERWESWAPKGRSIAELDEAQAGAQRRKDASITSKAATLAKQNERVQDIAERQKSVASSSLLETASKAQEKQMKAESNRAALMKEQVDKASTEYTKAVQMSARKKMTLASAARQSEEKLGQKLGQASVRRECVLHFCVVLSDDLPVGCFVGALFEAQSPKNSSAKNSAAATTTTVRIRVFFLFCPSLATIVDFLAVGMPPLQELEASTSSGFGSPLAATIAVAAVCAIGVASMAASS